MRFPVAGEELDGFYLSHEDAGKVRVDASPKGFEEYIGTTSFSVLRKFLYTIPLYVVVCDKVPTGLPPDLILETCNNYGPTLIFGRDSSFRSLTDFEYKAIENNIELEKHNGVCSLVLYNLTGEPMEWRQNNEERDDESRSL